MIKQKLYPSTKRVGSTDTQVVITEKLDGSNLGFFKYYGELYIAQRNRIFSLPGALSVDKGGPKVLYKGLFGWLEDHGEELKEELQPDACVFGEWIGMGKLTYSPYFGRFHQFAKCNVVKDEEDWRLKNRYYDRGLFKWSYVSQEQPEFIKSVPLVSKSTALPNKESLDLL